MLGGCGGCVCGAICWTNIHIIHTAQIYLKRNEDDNVLLMVFYVRCLRRPCVHADYMKGSLVLRMSNQKY